jgi:hypothetical protein
MRHGDGGQPQVLSLTPGRLRVHLPGWHGERADRIEARLRAVPGVRAVQANPLTGNVLVRFDPAAAVPTILAALPRQPEPGPDNGLSSVSSFVRFGVRGLLGHAAVDALWFGAGSLGQSLGVPLAGALGSLHILLDVVVWGLALTSVKARGGPVTPPCVGE